MHRWALIIVVVASAWALTDAVRAAEPVDYVRQIKPILKERCFACHGALKQKAGLRLDSGTLIRKGGDGGPPIISIVRKFWVTVLFKLRKNLMATNFCSGSLLRSKPTMSAREASRFRWMSAIGALSARFD